MVTRVLSKEPQKPETILMDCLSVESNSPEILKEKVVPSDFARSLELKLQEAERQRDEAREQVKVMTSNHISIVNKIATERDQLIEVVDEQNIVLKRVKQYIPPQSINATKAITHPIDQCYTAPGMP